MYEQAEPVRSPFSRPDSGQISGPQPQSTPVHQGGHRGRVRHGNGADKRQEEEEAASHTYEGRATYTSADRTYPGEASGRGGLCSFIRSHRSCMAAGIAVLVAVGLAPMTFINKEEISRFSTAVGALKRDQDYISTTVDALKRDQDDISATVAALKRGHDDMSATVAALKHAQEDIITTVQGLKRDLYKEHNLTRALEQRLHEMTSCPNGYSTWNGICYKAFNTSKAFSDAAAACGEDGGTLAMPRGAGTNAFLIVLHNSVSDDQDFWFGLHDQYKEGSFQWVDGSALGMYNSWSPDEPNNSGGSEDCVAYAAGKNDKWNDDECTSPFYFICQAVPGDTVKRLSDHAQ
uniref:C-type lectin domain-containing protein n=1 Tax=Branchiostoma floridae TaxID=7739 RepID=C3ZFW1_BRAFL|eukprot:XP_002592588.1 hypothetical protein BRAFLDRAFT_68911 [Branchiostoma floridae]